MELPFSFHLNPVTLLRKHGLHFFLRGLSHLPETVLHRCADSLHMLKYPDMDGHMRVILGLSNRSKKPARLGEIDKLRRQYYLGTTQMQAMVLGEDSVSVRELCMSEVADGRRARHYYSNNNPDKIVMLFIHGGGFCIGDLDTHDEVCRRVVQLTNWDVLSIDYRLAPEFPAPAAIDDCVSAYHWLIDNITDFSANVDSIVLCGDSAGACLATLTAQIIACQYQNLPQPLGQLLFYPVTDVEEVYESRTIYGEGLTLTRNDFEVFRESFFGNSNIPSERIADWTPMHRVQTGVAPAYIVVAGVDMLHDEGIAYANKLHTENGAVKVQDVCGAPHGFLHLLSCHERVGKETEKAIQSFADWMRKDR